MNLHKNSTIPTVPDSFVNTIPNLLIEILPNHFCIIYDTLPRLIKFPRRPLSFTSSPSSVLHPLHVPSLTRRQKIVPISRRNGVTFQTGSY